MSDRPRLVLGEEDFAEPEAPPAAPPRLNLPPVTRAAPTSVNATAAAAKTQVGAATWLNNPRTAPLIAAAAGMAIAWALAEILGLAEFTAHSKSELNSGTGVWTGAISLVFVGVMVGFDRAVQGAWSAAGRRFAIAAVPAFVLGFVAGYIAQALFTAIIESIERTDVVSPDDIRLYLARMAAWAAFGLGAGLAVGLVERSRGRAINGTIGGVVGGAVGGLIFHFASNQSDSAVFSRFLGLLAIGLLIALAMRVVETARREAWLSIVAGGMSGKEFIIYHQTTRIGASPDCEIFLLKDPGVAKLHAQIADHGHNRVLSAVGDAPTYVNQTPVSTHQLRDGDQIQVGSTVIAYSERALAQAVPSTSAQWR
jgi:hypothetical protein